MSDQKADKDLAQQLESLTDDVAGIRARTESVRHQATENEHLADIERHRTDSLEDRADAANHRATVLEQRVGEHGVRLDAVEGRLDVDEALLTELQNEGRMSTEHAEHLKEALRSARTIATAMGIIMAIRKVDETEAFVMLSKASQNSNRKLRAVADELVRTRELHVLEALTQADSH